MKTILDAVNTLKATWPSESIQIIEIDGVEFSEKEFNACVTECSNNFGLPIITAKPVYWDGKEELKVGMTVSACGCTGPHKIALLADEEYDVIITPVGRLFWQRTELKDVGVFDTRSDKEKAVDDLMDEQASLIGNIAYMKKSFGIAYDKWVK